MAERNPNSVLVSLKELRRIEEDRVTKERDAERNRQEAEVQARIDAERRARDEAEHRVRSEEDRVRREQEERERQEREGRVRVAEAERRARVEAEMHLEQHRIKMEAEAKALAKKVPWVPIGMAIGVLVLVVAGLGYFGYQKSKHAEEQEKALVAQKAEADKFKREVADQARRFQAEQDSLNKEKQELSEKLSSAKTDAQKELIRKQLKAQNDRQANLADRKARAKAAAEKAAKRIKVGDTKDPLGGLKL
ncbi:MAG: hypothetical protein IT371_18755 [Deltaproteobacteria bacterium]|nr:hypothetical protein [Deltaproteobacteria bacterium]